MLQHLAESGIPEVFLIRLQRRHGRACLCAMGMPQSKDNENRYFDGTERQQEWQIGSEEYQI